MTAFLVFFLLGLLLLALLIGGFYAVYYTTYFIWLLALRTLILLTGLLLWALKPFCSPTPAGPRTQDAPNR